ncbi:probable carboxylesterase 17 [Andrographis paniculata]|uniref:probable carboxylesterase 17 n=1 Tax=Andrographis paniculata TaxID=175694 RepID=UPI0021E7B815|nr:probable carboxylesterase 17 [Andrographis paniculata]
MGQEGRNIVDAVSGWLTVYDDGTVDRTWTGPPEVKFMSEPTPAHREFVDGVATADVVADEASGLRVRIYSPEKMEGEPEKLPVLLHFHGGGFCISRADWYMYYAPYTRLARVARVVVVSVYLRLAPEHRLPAAIEDGYGALMWLRAVAGGEVSEPWLEERADLGRVFLIGDSSGGNIVHQVAARAGKEGTAPVTVAGAIPIHPGFCRARRSKSELEQPETPFLTLDMVDKFIALALPEGATKDHPITCPMGEAAPPMEELELPPYLFCVAEQDLIKDTEMEFYEMMKKVGKEVELFVSGGVGHSFYLNKIAVDMDATTAAETEKLFEKIKEFIHSR